MTELTLDQKLAVMKLLINALPSLTFNFVFLNAIYRNINSGENTVAWHKTPFNNGTEERYSGYGSG